MSTEITKNPANTSGSNTATANDSNNTNVEENSPTSTAKSNNNNEVSDGSTKPEKSILRRVKLYHLNSEGKWDDKGTGHVSLEHSEKGDDWRIIMRSEEEGEEVLLNTKVSEDDIYQRQGDTLIVWSDPEHSIDMALSFQEAQGCQEVCLEICNIQGRKPEVEDEFDALSGEPDDDYFSDSSASLPEPEIGNLQKIEEAIVDASPFKKEKVVNAILDNGFLRKLFDIFAMCEDMDDLESLRTLFRIFRGMVLLNDSTLYETLFSDEYIMDLMGALEYDPELPVRKANHREFLNNTVIFKEVVKFSDPNLVNKIHQNFKIQYLKDTVLPRSLDDQSFSTLNTIIFYNNVEIVQAIQQDEEFLNEVFTLLHSQDTPTPKRRDLMMFLQELNSLAKNLQVNNKNLFYKTLSDLGLFVILEKAIIDPDLKIRQSGTDIIGMCLNYDPSMVRSFILSEKDKKHIFFRNVVQQLVSDDDVGIKGQLTEILKLILDSETLERQEKDEILQVFYSDLLDILVAPLSKTKPDPTETAEAFTTTKFHVCGILSFCVQQHGYHIRYYVLRNNVLAKVLQVLSSNDKALVLAGIKFFRACVSLKDDFYNRYIVKNKLFDPIIQVFIDNGPRYNLINSAIIELFEFIRKENIKILIEYAVEKYQSQFEKITYVDTFKLLILKYQQNNEKGESLSKTSTPTDAQSLRRGGRIVDEEDESYWDESDEEEESTRPTTTTVKTVASPSSLASTEAKTRLLRSNSSILKKARLDPEADNHNMAKNGSALTKLADEDDEDDSDFNFEAETAKQRERKKRRRSSLGMVVENYGSDSDSDGSDDDVVDDDDTVAAADEKTATLPEETSERCNSINNGVPTHMEEDDLVDDDEDEDNDDSNSKSAPTTTKRPGAVTTKTTTTNGTDSNKGSLALHSGNGENSLTTATSAGNNSATTTTHQTQEEVMSGHNEPIREQNKQ